MTLDVNTIKYDMPTTITAYVVKNPDTSFTIILNSRMPNEKLLEAYRHEIRHIESGDYDHSTADMIEIYAHGLK